MIRELGVGILLGIFGFLGWFWGCRFGWGGGAGTGIGDAGDVPLVQAGVEFDGLPLDGAEFFVAFDDVPDPLGHFFGGSGAGVGEVGMAGAEVVDAGQDVGVEAEGFGAGFEVFGGVAGHEVGVGGGVAVGEGLGEGFVAWIG